VFLNVVAICLYLRYDMDQPEVLLGLIRRVGFDPRPVSGGLKYRVLRRT
jgi:hypothetical protein